MPALEKFNKPSTMLTVPAESAFAVTPHDSNELSAITRAIYVGGSGNIAAVMVDGAEVTFANVQYGSLLPLRIRKIKATGTTATNIVGVL